MCIRDRNNISRIDNKRTWQVIKKLNNSQNNPPPSHESPSLPDNSLPSSKQQADSLAKHYANISRKPTLLINRVTKKQLKKLPSDHNPPPPFTTNMISETIKTLKNSPATGPDSISNFHLKHLGRKAILLITEIFNKSWKLNYIPPIWKQAFIIPKLKPKKNPNSPSSYRPISLLCSISKLLEKLILNKISNPITLPDFQHGFKSNHSTTTALTSLTQHILNGFNQSPSHRSILLSLIHI